MKHAIETVIAILSATYVVTLFRLFQVRDFRMELLTEEGRFWRDSIERGIAPDYVCYRRFDELPTYGEMMIRFWRPLEYWRRPLAEFYPELVGVSPRLPAPKSS